MQDPSVTIDLMLWFSDTKNYMYRPWTYLHERGAVDSYETIQHDGFRNRPIQYLRKYVETKDRTWIQSIPPYHYSILPFVLSSHLQKESIFFTSYPKWDEPLQFGGNRGLKALWQQYLDSSRVVTVTERARQSIKHVHGVNSAVIPHACDTNVYSPREESSAEQRPVVLFVGRLVEEKGIESVLRFADGCDERAIWICGDGPLRKNVEIAAEDNENVRYFGYISDDEKLSEIYNRASVLVLPSRRHDGWEEYFGLVLIEAMACGTPVVASDHAGPESIVTQETGSLIDDGSADELAAAVDDLLADEERRQRMGKQGRRRAVERYSTEVVAKQWLDVLRD